MRISNAQLEHSIRESQHTRLCELSSLSNADSSGPLMQIVCQSIYPEQPNDLCNLFHRGQVSLDSTERREVDLTHAQYTTA